MADPATSHEQRHAAARAAFLDAYGGPAERVRLARVPYRICPLGAHIDHQLGTVTGMALDHALLLAYAPRADATVRIRSRNFQGEVVLPLDRAPSARQNDWGDYVRGAVHALVGRFGPLGAGLDGYVLGDDRIGGLSSSAAVGCAYLLALEDVNGLNVTPEDNIELDRVLENEYIGLSNGLLDQSMILLSRRGHLTRMDCRSRRVDRIALPPSAPPCSVLVAYSGLNRKLTGTDYNRRVDECREAARMLLTAAGISPPAAPVLGDVPDRVLAERVESLPDPWRKRARHFWTETQRVQLGAALWARGDLAGFGRLMTESGRSSVENYECGGPHLRSLYDILRETDGVYGARFSGAGFRGCCIALAAPDPTGRVAREVLARYAALHPDAAGAASVFFCSSADGASVVGASEEK